MRVTMSANISVRSKFKASVVYSVPAPESWRPGPQIELCGPYNEGLQPSRPYNWL